MIPSFSSIRVSAGFGSFNEGTTKPDGEEPYAESLLSQIGIKADDNREEYEPIKIPMKEAQNLKVIGQVMYIGHRL